MKFIFCFIAVLWWEGVFAQVCESDRLLLRFEERFAKLDSLIFPVEELTEKFSVAGSRLDTIAPGRVAGQAYDSVLMNYIDAEIREFKSKTGLELAGQAYYRLDGPLGVDDDDAESRYNGKFQFELRWHILQSSLFGSKGRVEAIRLQGAIDHVSNQREHLGQLIYRQKEFFRQEHDSLLSGVLQHRVRNLVLLSDANVYLLQRENVSSDELLKILNERAEAERLLAMLAGNFPESPVLSRPRVQIVEIDTANLIRYIRETQTDLRLLRLRMQLLEQQENNVGYWQQVKLTPFVRYSYYTRPQLSNSSNVDAGISFTFPISSEAGGRKKTLRAKRDLLAVEQEQITFQITDRIRFIAGEIGRLNRALEGEYRRVGKLKNYLLQRIQAYENRIGEYSLLARTKEYNIYLLCIEKMIGFQYQRDCYVADLQGLLADVPILWYSDIGLLTDDLNRNK